MHYTADRLVRLARRDNNAIRPYLYVNPLQAKHIPASPRDVLDMCRAAAELVNRACPGERLFVIGFAETATGIASAISSFLPGAFWYQNTTREQDGQDCLPFAETHSHAPSQFLRTRGLEEALRDCARIVLIDDEVTTGSTILHLTDILRERYHVPQLKVTILSLLNSMSEERLSRMRDVGIDCLYLCRIPYEYQKDTILDITADPALHRDAPQGRAGAPLLRCFGPVNPRHAAPYQAYQEACQGFARALLAQTPEEPADRTLVLGTEECMYPAIVFADLLLKTGRARQVLTHATTRSPIIASESPGYPLRSRVRLPSPYDPERTTYIYNLARYDRVFILTDADPLSPGIAALTGALEQAGNTDIRTACFQY